VIYNRQRDKILVARRPDRTHLGGYWEFPGGKVEPGESIEHALYRELYEELNLQVRFAAPLIVIDHDYPDRSVTLDTWAVYDWSGELAGSAGQEIAWCGMQELPAKRFPAANLPIITAARLPPVCLVIHNREENKVLVAQEVRTWLLLGARLILLTGMSAGMTRAIISEAGLETLCRKYNAVIMTAAQLDAAGATGLAGVHDNSRKLAGLQFRSPTGNLVAASCSTPHEVRDACMTDVDFIIFEPNKPVSADPDYYWTYFKRIAREATVPVFAAGGMQSTDLARAVYKGGQGIVLEAALLKENTEIFLWPAGAVS
jgi:8-oxo-dGTP diphosphatase